MCPVGGFLVPRWVPVKSNPSDGSSAPSPLRSQKSTFRTHAVIGSAEGADVVLDLFVAPRTSMAVGYIVARGRNAILSKDLRRSQDLKRILLTLEFSLGPVKFFNHGSVEVSKGYSQRSTGS